MQIQDGLRLAVGELPRRDQAFLGFLGRFAAADQLDDVVEVFESFLEAEQDVLALFRFAQIELRPAPHDIHAVLDEELEQLNQAEFARLASDDREQDHPERLLHLRVLEEIIEDELRFLAALDLDDDAHSFAGRFIAHIRDAIDLLGLHQFGDALDQLRLVHLVRDLE